MDEFRKKSRIEKLQDKLYQKENNLDFKEDRELRPKEYSLENRWKEEAREEERPLEETIRPFDLSEDEFYETDKKKFGFFGWILTIAALFFVGAVGYAGYALFFSEQVVSADQVDINIVGPVSVGGGEKLSLDVIVQNKNEVALELVDLVVEYPEGTKEPGNLINDLRRTRQDLGRIESGSIARESINAALFGEEGENKEIIVSVEYRVSGSNAVFEKKKIFEIALNASPVRVVAEGLKEISSGQQTEIELKVSSNSNNTLNNVMVIAEYPFGFFYEGSNIKPTYGRNTWVFDKLEPKEEKTIIITGRIEGQNEEDRVFRFNTGIVSEENKEDLGVIFSTVLHEVAIQKSFVELDLEFNQKSDPIFIANSGDYVTVDVIFTNNTNDIINDLNIDIEMTGKVLDELNIDTRGGFYDSIDNTVTFNKDTDSGLESVLPRKEYKRTFRFKTYDLSLGKVTVNNPEIKVEARVNGIRTSDENVEEKIHVEEFKTVKILTDVLVKADTNHSEGPFQNSGSLPPKAEQETEYTITWRLANSSSDLENTLITAHLPSYVKWKNQTTPSSEDISFDSATRTVTWNLGKVNKGDGFVSAAREIHFQVALEPSLSQVGSAPTLLNNTTFKAKDTFTDTTIEKSVEDADTYVEGLNLGNGYQYVVE